MFWAASSSKTVPLKLSPPLSGPPGWSASRTVVPSGPVTSIARSPTNGWAIPAMLTFTSLMRPRSGTNTEEVTPAALSSGIATGARGRVALQLADPGAPVGSTTGTVWVSEPVVIASVAAASAPQAAALARWIPKAVLFAASPSPSGIVG